METYRPQENSRHEDLLSKLHTLNADSLKSSLEIAGKIQKRAKDTEKTESQAAPVNSFDKWLDRFENIISFDNMFI